MGYLLSFQRRHQVQDQDEPPKNSKDEPRIAVPVIVVFPNCTWGIAELRAARAKKKVNMPATGEIDVRPDKIRSVFNTMKTASRRKKAAAEAIDALLD